MPLYDNPKLIKRAHRLMDRGYGRKSIAEQMGVSLSTVRKILVPGFAEAERERHRAVDAARAPRWENDTYREYQIEYGKRPERIAQIVRQRAEGRAS